MKSYLLAGLIHSSFRTVRSEWVIVSHKDFLFFSNDSVEMRGEDVSESSANDNDVIFLQIRRSSFTLLAKTQGESVTGEELPCCDVAHG